MKTRILTVNAIAALLLVAQASLPVAARAETLNSWIDGNGKWETNTNWSAGVAPSLSDAADLITNAGNNTVTIDATTSGSYPASLTINSLTVGANSLQLTDTGTSVGLRIQHSLVITNGGSIIIQNSGLRLNGSDPEDVCILGGTLELDGGTITSANMTVGVGAAYGTGTLTIEGGTMLVGALSLGGLDGAQGNLVLSGGTLQSTFPEFGQVQVVNGTVLVTGGQLISTNNQGIYIGWGGSGQMTVLNGSVISGPITVGIEEKGQGTLTIAGGTVESTRLVAIGSFTSSTGMVWVTGGQLVVTNSSSSIWDGMIAVGYYPDALGQMTVSNGTVLANSLIVATNGNARGVFTVAGGNVLIGGQTISNGFRIGVSATGTGEVSVVGGAQLTVTNTATVIGDIGSGSLTVSNGSVKASQTTIGAGTNSLGMLKMLAGSAMHVSSKFIVSPTFGSTGTVMVSGGLLTVTNGVFGVGNTGTLTDGSGTGTMTVTNGTVVCASMVLGSTNGGSGTLYIRRDGLVQTLCGRTLNDEVVDGGTDQVIENSGIDCSFEDVNLHNRIVAGYLRDGALTVTNGGTVIAPEIVIGLTNGTGRLNLADGTVTATRNLFVGMNLNSTGAVTVAGGLLTATNGVIGIGNTGTLTDGSGTGTMTVTNGTVVCASMVLGSTNGGSGTLYIQSGGLVQTLCGRTLNDEVVDGGTDQVIENSGVDCSFEDPNLHNRIVAGYLRDGTLTVTNGGTVIAPEIVIGLTNGTGRLNLADGTVTATRNLFVGMGLNSTGTVMITGGSLTVTNGVFGVGNAGAVTNGSGSGTLTVTNGTVVCASMVLGSTTGGSGTVNILRGGLIETLGGRTLNDELVDGGTDLVIENTGPPYNFEDPNLHNRIVAGYLRDGTLTVTNGGTVTAPEIVMGLTNGTGRLNLAVGTVGATRNFYVGMGPTSTGIVVITGGSLTVTNGVFGVGNDGTSGGTGGVAHVTVSDGLVDGASILVGDTAGGDSSLTVAGTGYVRTHGGLRSNGIKTTLVNGGTLEVLEGAPLAFEDPILHNRIVVSYLADGMLIVSNGTVRTPGIVVGASPGNTGTLSLAGGNTSVYSNMTVGLVACTARGIVNATGGNLYVTNAAHNAVLEIRDGTFTMVNGTVQADVIVMTNTCGQLFHLGGTLLYNQLVLAPNQSAVGDGIPNWWKQQYGLDPFDPSVANADPDGDGFSNWQEYLNGTDPTSIQSSPFHITTITRQSNDVLITWMTAGGNTNVVQAAAGGSGGRYMTSYTNFPPVNVISNGGFEIDAVSNAPDTTAITGWSTGGGGTKTVSSYPNPTHGGAGALRLLDTASQTPVVFQGNPGSSHQLPTTAGQVWDLTGYSYIWSLDSPLVGGYGMLKIVWNDSSGNTLQPVASDSNLVGSAVSGTYAGIESVHMDPSFPENSWQFLEARGTAPAGAAYVEALGILAGSGGGGAVRFDDISLAQPVPSNAWHNLCPAIVVAGSGVVTTNYLDVGGATNRPARYYRVSMVTTQMVPGVVWTPTAFSQPWMCVASSADGTKLIAGASNGHLIYTSTDSGVTWTARASSQYWSGVASSADGTKLVATAINGDIYTSTDSGVTWTDRAAAGSHWWSCVASSADGTKLAAAWDYVCTSTDSGATWTPQTHLGFSAIASSADGTKLVGVVYGGLMYLSTDSGVTWTVALDNHPRYWTAVASSTDGTKLVAVRWEGTILTSSDSGATWVDRGYSAWWSSVASSADGTKLVAVAGNGGLIYTSTDSGVTWTARASSQSWSSVASSADGNKLVAVVNGGLIYTSCLCQ